MAESVRIDPTILREYDVRGVVGESLTAEVVHRLAGAFGTRIVQKGGASVAVGYDGRLTSPELESAAVDGLAECGLKVYRVERGPTPMLYFATHSLATDGGLMITGSHNPPEFNGIKFVLGGEAFYGDDIQALGQAADQGYFAEGGGRIIDRPVIDEYVERLLAGYDGGRPLDVVWDPGNGAAGEAVERLCRRLPGRQVVINGTIDGTFPAHHPDPTVEANLVQLKQRVAAEGADFGVAFDGDGDRIGMIDERGRVLWGDQILLVLARDVLSRVPGATIIADVKSSQVLFDEVARMGGNPLMWCSGHSLVKAKMAETGAPLAGEMSGHIFFGEGYYGFDDAVYGALRMVSIVANGTQSLAQMLDAIPKRLNTPELRFDCPEDRKFEVVEEVKARLAGVDGLRVADIDGVRVQSEDGWWLLRASNTQAVLVARCEAETADGLDRLRAALADQLGASGIAPPDFS